MTPLLGLLAGLILPSPSLGSLRQHVRPPARVAAPLARQTRVAAQLGATGGLRGGFTGMSGTLSSFRSDQGRNGTPLRQDVTAHARYRNETHPNPGLAGAPNGAAYYSGPIYSRERRPRWGAFPGARPRIVAYTMLPAGKYNTTPTAAAMQAATAKREPKAVADLTALDWGG